MRKRDLFFLVGMMACFTGAVMALIITIEQSRRRSIINVDILCQTLVEITNKPCALLAPPSGANDNAASERR